MTRVWSFDSDYDPNSSQNRTTPKPSSSSTDSGYESPPRSVCEQSPAYYSGVQIEQDLTDDEIFLHEEENSQSVHGNLNDATTANFRRVQSSPIPIPRMRNSSRRLRRAGHLRDSSRFVNSSASSSTSLSPSVDSGRTGRTISFNSTFQGTNPFNAFNPAFNPPAHPPCSCGCSRRHERQETNFEALYYTANHHHHRMERNERETLPAVDNHESSYQPNTSASIYSASRSNSDQSSLIPSSSHLSSPSHPLPDIVRSSQVQDNASRLASGALNSPPTQFREIGANLRRISEEFAASRRRKTPSTGDDTKRFFIHLVTLVLSEIVLQLY